MSAAVEYFGSKTKAKEWLDKPSRALSYKKPIELISSESGAQTVLNLIGHMSYGVYS
ncbi:toxin-antitoxin system, antitoxin component domain protein [Escherichia coli A35218R]|nr:toxin-antitoxin system, antitoxin component domain protein [Escherichia coli A35218R]